MSVEVRMTVESEDWEKYQSLKKLDDGITWKKLTREGLKIYANRFKGTGKKEEA